ncbi:MAG: sulfotransferase [Haliea sp.]|nr:sulfotransferase [Haliea sp.]
MSAFSRRYPDVYRIDDFDNPWLPLPVRLLNAVPDTLIRRFTRLDEQRLLQRAIQATGLDDFGDEDFRAPFRLLLEDLNTLDHFTPMGRITVQTVLHEQLCSRLCLQEQLKRQPDIAQHKIDRPVFIAGLPRTGTTHLHNLLSQCTQLRYLPLWQTLHPIAPQPGQADRRRRAADLAVNATGFIIPLFKRMHEMATDAPHEELTLCALGYRSFFFEGAFQVPKYRDWYANHSQVKGYAFLRQVLQMLEQEPAQGNKTSVARAPGARWILKSPQHVDQLEAILTVFPDARLILTHRDPARAVLSMITMILYTSRQVYRPRRLREEANAWVDRLEQMLRRSQQQAAAIPGDNVFHVAFDAFMENPEKTIERICEFAQIDLDPVSRQAIQRHLASSARDRHGRIDYRFESLGLDEAEIRARFDFYTTWY